MHVLSGPDERDPSSLPNDGKDFLAAATGNSVPRETGKIAYAGNLGGVVPLDPEVESLVKSAVRRFEEFGFSIEEDCFDTSSIKEIVTGTRGFGMVARYADRFDAHRELMTDQLVGQVSAALQLSVRDVVKSEKLRTQYWHNVRKFMQRYDFIIAPAVGAPPFRLDEPFPSQVGGKPVERFQDVFLATYIFSVTGLPMISLPSGFTRDGRPVGMQVITKRFCDDRVIALGAAYEKMSREFFCRPEVDLSDVRPVSDDLNTPNVFMGKTS
tara:strand:- start:4413 stop:5219 length:807 start_codon:yes stop_codon:yes gene_type:complete